MNNAAKIIFLVFFMSGYLASQATSLTDTLGGLSTTPHYHHPSHNHDHDHENILLYTENKGQWHPNVLYRADLGSINKVFLEKDRLTYLFHEATGSEKMLAHGPSAEKKPSSIDAHAYQVVFENIYNSKIIPSHPKSYTKNYFKGKDKSKWARGVKDYEWISYSNLYKNIDLKTYSIDGHFKYDFIVQPSGNPDDIKLTYEGVDAIKIVKGELQITTSVDKIIEFEPYVYQEIKGQKILVECNYVLERKQLGFEFPNGYNPSYPLIIDPTVVAATLSGNMFETVWGHSATYDLAGNIYTGGESFGIGYPTTIGAFQQNFGGGETDIAISKLNPDGSQLEWATYLGGSGADRPHSLVTDIDGQLYMYGTSNSSNYPTLNDNIQSRNAGKYDIVVTILSQNGESLIASTYIGGAENDGLNINTNSSNIDVSVHETNTPIGNYGDIFRGEIYLDSRRNVYISSHTASNNFPITSGAFQTTFNSQIGEGTVAMDAVVFKMNSNLTEMIWSTYLGQEGPDTGTNLRIDSEENVYVTGTAGSAQFPMPDGGYNSNFLGGATDAYVVKISSDGSELLNGTFFGTNEDDSGYFLDLGTSGEVHIYGLTEGLINVTPGTYSYNEGSRQFISAFNDELSELLYATVIGLGPNSTSALSVFTEFDFVPVAFMVDNCDKIYFSGYAANSNLPVTRDALYNIPQTFYLGVLDKDARDLFYGTYYANASHVDGGTSRFDKGGTVYQAVCSCNFAPSAPPAVMETNDNAFATSQSTSCDVGIFKIDFELPVVTANALALPSTSGCAPFEIDFRFAGQNANQWDWDFGDGTSSTSSSPNKTYYEAGVYDVQLIASNIGTCNEKDTLNFIVNVSSDESTLVDTLLCGGNSYSVNVTATGATYNWSDGSTSPIRTFEEDGTYWVDVELPLCIRRDSFIIDFEEPYTPDIIGNFSICDSPTGILDASVEGAESYIWDDGSTNPERIVTEPGIYSITVFAPNGCDGSSEINVQFGETPRTELGPPDTLCIGDSRTAFAPNLTSLNINYEWNTGDTSSQILIEEEGDYIVTVSNNGCGFSDTLSIDYIDFELEFDKMDVRCYGECNGQATAIYYGDEAPFILEWENGSSSDERVELCSGTYPLTITDARSCVYEYDLIIEQPDSLVIQAEGFDITCALDSNGVIEITEILGGTPPYQASNDGGNTFIDDVIFNRLNGGNYDVLVQDANGCNSNSLPIDLYEPPYITLDAGDPQTIKLGDSTNLNGIVYPLFNNIFSWLPSDSLDCLDCISPVVDPTQSTYYVLTSTDTISGCFLADTTLVRVEKDRNVYIPNAFSPNGDGNNDIFRVYTGLGVREILEINIFDRWGEHIYSARNVPAFNLKFGWDGDFKGKALNSGVFVYQVKVAFVDDVIKDYAGDVTLIR